MHPTEVSSINSLSHTEDIIKYLLSKSVEGRMSESLCDRSRCDSSILPVIRQSIVNQLFVKQIIRYTIVDTGYKNA